MAHFKSLFLRQSRRNPNTDAGLGVGIYYSAQGVGNRNAFNEVLTVGDDAGEMFLRATTRDWAGRMEDQLSAEAAAEYQWQKLKGPLG